MDMKEIIALIRSSKVENTKKALEAIGLPGMTSRKVMGKGKAPIDILDDDGQIIMKSHMMPKRKIIIEVEDKDVERVVTIITIVNSTDTQGDGKIFVLPVLGSYQISTGARIC
jgi:nitrogen regulatory protein PII 2